MFRVKTPQHLSARREERSAYLFAASWLLGVLLLVAFPFCASLYFSLCRYDLLSAPQFRGLQNYARLAEDLWHGDRFSQALWNTIYFAAISVPLSIALGVLLAVLLSRPVRGQSIYRAAIFLPCVIPVMVSTILWMWLLDPRSGVVNQILQTLGLPQPGWFKGIGEIFWPGNWFTGNSLPGSKDALILMSLWGSGNFMMIYLAALGDIPKQLYEAAALDGAGPIRRFVHITLPGLSGVILFNLVLGIIHALQAFTAFYIAGDARGDPAGSTLTLSMMIFLTAFKDLNMGYASAMAWGTLVGVLVLTAILFRWSRNWVFYRGAI